MNKVQVTHFPVFLEHSEPHISPEISIILELGSCLGQVMFPSRGQPASDN